MLRTEANENYNSRDLQSRELPLLTPLLFQLCTSQTPPSHPFVPKYLTHLDGSLFLAPLRSQ